MGQVGKLLAHGCYFCNKVVDEMVLFVYSFVCLIWATALGVHLQLLFSNFVGQWTEQDPYIIIHQRYIFPLNKQDHGC